MARSGTLDFRAATLDIAANPGTDITWRVTISDEGITAGTITCTVGSQTPTVDTSLSVSGILVVDITLTDTQTTALGSGAFAWSLSNTVASTTTKYVVGNFTLNNHGNTSNSLSALITATSGTATVQTLVSTSAATAIAAHLIDPTAVHAASAVSFAPTESNDATTTQAAIAEAALRSDTGVYYPDKLARWRAALGDAGVGTSKQPVITCVGDSLTSGHYAWNSVDLSVGNWPTGRANGWVGRLRSLLAVQYGNAGEGFMFVPTSAVASSFLEDRVTLTAGVIVACGPFGAGYAVANGQSITVLAPQCTSIDIFGLWRNGANAAFTYTVDGGGSQNGPTHNSVDLMYKHTISGLADTTHTLVINGPATLRADIGGIVCKRGSSGVLVNRVGRGSQTADLAVYNLLPAARNWVLSSTFTLQQTDLAIIMFRINEVATAYSAAAFRTNIKILTDWVTAMGGCSLLVPDPVAATVETTTTFADYRAQMLDIATVDDHVAFLDIDRFWGGPAWTSDALDLRVEDVHPNSRGYGDLARIIHRAITQITEYS